MVFAQISLLLNVIMLYYGSLFYQGRLFNTLCTVYGWLLLFILHSVYKEKQIPRVHRSVCLYQFQSSSKSTISITPFNVFSSRSMQYTFTAWHLKNC